ncbi:MAG: Smr/MutS family protein [Fibrobacter sp.]|nr:Smr/MutS family protein [Fibrobacter sp.]
MNKNDGRDEILEYIQAHGTVDKDCTRPSNPKPKQFCRKHAVRVVLDLHGMKSDEAVRKIRLFFNQSISKGIREILIIHGRGIHSKSGDGPVLKTLVRNMLEMELRNLIRDYRAASPRDGGDGATLVYLK